MNMERNGSGSVQIPMDHKPASESNLQMMVGQVPALPSRLSASVLHGIRQNFGTTKPISLQPNITHIQLPNQPIRAGRMPSPSSTVAIRPIMAADVSPSHSMRPTILQPKPVHLKTTQGFQQDPSKGLPIPLGSIVTADGTTTLKITSGNMGGQSSGQSKLPNIIRTHGIQGTAPHIQGLPSTISVHLSQSGGLQNENSFGPPDGAGHHLNNSVQIFPVSGTHQDPNQQDVMCLSIVNGKIQNIRDASETSGSELVIESSEAGIESQLAFNVLQPLDENNFREDAKSSEKESNTSPLERSGLKLTTNEFNAVEIDSFTSIKVEIHEEENIDLSCKEVPPPSPRKDGTTIPSSGGPRIRDDDILCCNGCGCYGMSSEFFDADACSSECKNRIAQKIKEKEKRERELQVQKARREAKKKEREAKEAEDRRQRETQPKPDPVDKEELFHGFAPRSGVNEELSPDQLNEFHPWKDGNSFSWQSYLDFSNSKAAPSKLFQCPFPPEGNPFQVGMRLESIDPEHPALICVVSVAAIKGYRMRLHFDGYSESYDFWENANSPNIFPVGFCAAQKQRLQPPKNYEGKEFKWNTYLKQIGSKAAPREAFRHRPEASDLSGWRIGLKLEAVDRQNTSLVCVASVTNILDGRILVHFDGWEMDFDYWTRPTSPYIHPVGWCDQNGVKLNPPKGHSDQFSWERYLKETCTLPVPSWAFKPPRSEVSLFRKGMKLEAVDKRNPSLIRVATVADVLMHQIKIHFDGWPDVYDFWVEDNSQDIHPPTWCSKTVHPLMPPLTTEEVKYFTSLGGCHTPGCRGIGHVKGSKYVSHFTVAACPYAQQNLDNDTLLPDRLQWMEKCSDENFNESQIDGTEQDDDDEEPTKEETKDKKSISSLGRGNRKRKPRKFFDEVTSGSKIQQSAPQSSVTCTTPQPKHRRMSTGAKSASPILRPSSEQNNHHNTMKLERPSQPDEPTSQPSHPVTIVRSNVYQPPYNYAQAEFPASAWDKNSAFLKHQVGELTSREVVTWSPRQVAHFVSSIPGIRVLNGDDIFQRIIEEEIDGEAFMLLTQFDLVKLLGLKLGPAIKVFNAILLIQAASKSDAAVRENQFSSG